MKPKKVMFPTLVSEMARRGETQTYLASVLETNCAKINRKLNGKTEWTIDDVAKLCKHFEMDFYELFKKNN